ARGNSIGRPIDLSPRNIHLSPSSKISMPESDSKKSRRSLKSLPPDRFQPKMLIFWLVLVAAVLALLYNTQSMNQGPEILQIQEVVERAEAGNIKQDAKNPAVMRSDLSAGRNWYVITGESRRDS